MSCARSLTNVSRCTVGRSKQLLIILEKVLQNLEKLSAHDLCCRREGSHAHSLARMFGTPSLDLGFCDQVRADGGYAGSSGAASGCHLHVSRNTLVCIFRSNVEDCTRTKHLMCLQH